MRTNCTNQVVLTVLEVGILQRELSRMELSTIKCEFLYAECFQTFHCTYRLFFIFEVCYGLVYFYLYFSRAAISGISVLAVPLDLFCCTCYFVVFLSQ